METAETVESVRSLVNAARKRGQKIGFVPTMGALHAGHVSLMEEAGRRCEFVAVSIFVNPTQFVPGEDYEKYPRTLEADMEICRKAGVDMVFVPSAAEMYPQENYTWVDVEKISEGLCGQSRPGHFRGVATVCTKLFNIIGPDEAFFGQKDAQQAAVIRRMAGDLNMPLEIVVCPTVREADGFAMSSRNKYLSDKERKDAAVLYKALLGAKKAIEAGTADVETITGQMRKVIEAVGGVKIEYISIVDAETLEPVARVEGKVLAAGAVKVGSTRLIDNMVVDFGG